MSVSKVKELFYLATNAKMVLGGSENEQAEKLREALAISKSDLPSFMVHSPLKG